MNTATPYAKPKGNPLKILLIYSILMITAPLLAFFISKNVAESVFGIPSSQSYIYSTVVSVVTVHIILGLFVYEAYHEDSSEIVFAAEKED